jgi:dTDP-4-dehydrorhamnose reductase
MKRRLLLTGATGFLGYNFLQQNLIGWEVIAATHQRPFAFNGINTVALDLATTNDIEKVFATLQPQAVVHLAAIADTNFCEHNEALAAHINVNATVTLATLCRAADIPFLFTSTDLVFDGTKGNYIETDTTQPLNIYGRQKVAAENKVLEIYDAACVLRMPLMFGNGGAYAQSFMQPFLAQLKKGETLSLFTDEHRSVVDGNSAAKGILHALNHHWKGLYHLGGKEKLSRYDFGMLLCETFGIHKSLIKPTLQSEVKMAAPRPPDVSLHSHKAYSQGYAPASASEALKQLARHYPL